MISKRWANLLLTAGIVLAIAGASWWYLFYSEAIKLFEDGTMQDVVKCLYAYTEDCGIVNSGIALLAGATAYNPALFLVGMALSVAGGIARFLSRKT